MRAREFTDEDFDDDKTCLIVRKKSLKKRMLQDDDAYLVVKVDTTKPRLMDDLSYQKRLGRNRKIGDKKGRFHLREYGHRRKKLPSEVDGRYGIYENSYFVVKGYQGNDKKPQRTLKIAYLLDRIEVHPNRSTILSVEEWDGVHRTFVKRFFGRNREGDWVVGKKAGINYMDLKPILSETDEARKKRTRILKLLGGSESV